ncbi:MAG: F0F1 ATP synthase subunit epsilon [Chloroflexota bacterium]
MAFMHLDVLTVERTVLSVDVRSVVLPAVEGEISVLPGHMPLVAMLTAGELVARTETDAYYLAISGGFVRVMPGSATVLADASERAEEIDIYRAEQAKARAQQLLEAAAPDVDLATAEAALRRAVARIFVAEKHRRRRITRMAPSESSR